MTNELDCAIETAKAWREARDVTKPGSPQWKELDELYRRAEAEVHRLRP